MKGVLVTVLSTATLILDGATGQSSYPRAGIMFVTTGGQTVFLGGADVDSTNGFPVLAGTAMEIQSVNEPLYGIVASGSQTVNILRSGD